MSACADLPWRRPHRQRAASGADHRSDDVSADGPTGGEEPTRWFTEEVRADGSVDLAEHPGRAEAEAHAERVVAQNGSTVVLEERVGVHLKGRWEYPPGR